MSEEPPANSIHVYYNEKLRTEARLYEKMIEQLNTKISNLKSEVLVVNKANQSLKSRLHSANNMLRILTSNRELEYDFSKMDCVFRSKLLENDFSGEIVKKDVQNMPKKVDAIRNVGLKKVQNKPVVQRRQLLKTQHSQVASTNNIESAKLKPVVNKNTTSSKIPVYKKSSNAVNSMNNKKENLAPRKTTNIASKKPELPGTKSVVNKWKGAALQKKEDILKKTKTDAEQKQISLNKTYKIDH